MPSMQEMLTLEPSFADNLEYDVVVVGAGLAGLTTAHKILKKRASLRVLIIEGNDYAGGRILPEDLSKSYFAYPTQLSMITMLMRLRIPIILRRESRDQKRIFLTKNGPVEKVSSFVGAQVAYFLQQINEYSLDSCFARYNRSENANELAASSVDRLLCQLVFLSRPRSLCRTFIYNVCGIRDPKDVSALWFLVMLHGAGGFFNRLRATLGDENRFFVEGGMRKITDTLLHEISLEHGNVMFGEHVLKVQPADNGKYYVVTNRSKIKCKYVAIAVPPPENDRIVIEPTLPENVLRSRVAYEPARNTYFNAIYAQPFWRNEYTGDVLTTLDSATIVNFVYDATLRTDDTEYILAGYLKDDECSSSSMDDLRSTLKKCFTSNDNRTSFAYNENKWTPFDYFETQNIGGGGSPMSVLRPSSLDCHIDLLKSPHGNEYAHHWPGTADGAIEAGRITATLILMHLRPQSLNIQEIIFATLRDWKRTTPRRAEVTFIFYACLVMNVSIFVSYLRRALQ